MQGLCFYKEKRAAGIRSPFTIYHSQNTKSIDIFLEIMLHSIGSRFRATAHAQLRKDAADIITNRSFPEEQRRSDLAVGLAF